MPEFILDRYIVVACALGILIWGLYKRKPTAALITSIVFLGLMFLMHVVTLELGSLVENNYQRHYLATPATDPVLAPSFEGLLLHFIDFVFFAALFIAIVRAVVFLAGPDSSGSTTKSL